MLRITVDDRRGLRTFTFTKDVVTIGRGKERDLVLAIELVSRLHAEVRVDRARREVVIEDKSENGVWRKLKRGEKRIDETGVAQPEEWFRFADVNLQFRFEDFELADVTAEAERGFLAALKDDPRDDATRAVYADWLEEQGKRKQAEFLRTQVTARGRDADDPVFKAASARLAALAPALDLAWRARVAMAVVQACGEQVAGRAGPVAFELECTRRWDEMVPTAVEGVRMCTACKKDVVYCTSIDQAFGWAEEGGCVAVDAAVSRKRGDLIGRDHMMRGRPAPNVAWRGTKRV